MPNHYGAGTAGSQGQTQNQSGTGPGGQGADLTTTMGNSTNQLLTTIGSVLSVGDHTDTNVTITQGYFTNNAGLLQGSNIHSGTLASSNQKYYFNVTNTHPESSSAENQFSVAFGHRGGSGSNVLAGNEAPTLVGETRAIYQQFASLLLPENEISGGFKISQQGSGGQISAGGTDEYIYVLIANRDRFKDKLDNKSWTIKLSGHYTTGSNEQVGVLSLTDDSDSNTQTGSFSSIVGPRYNIVSGAAGAVHTASKHRTFGHFFPHMGVMVFSGAELSSSIPGRLGTEHITASFSANTADTDFISSSGFAPNLYDNGNPKNALRFVNCLHNIGENDIRLRGSQEQRKVSYFCTVRPNECNYSNNATFISGSEGKLRHKSMYGNPTTYITGLGLHDENGTLVAVAKLSTPIQKNRGVQQTIKINLTY